MNYDLIMYDLDGTILNYETAEDSALKATLLRFFPDSNLDALAESYREVNAFLWKEFEKNRISSVKLRTERFRLLLEKEGIRRIDKTELERISDFYLKRLSESAVLLDGAGEVIRFYHGKAAQVIISNGLSDVQHPRIRQLPVAECFDRIFISEEIGYPKPDPRIFEHVCAEFEMQDKKRIIIIGDNLESDIRGGNDFGVDTCWFNPNKLHNDTKIVPTYEIADLKKIYGVIK